MTESGVQRVGVGAGPLLSQVSRHWRAIACDLPPLWSSFGFQLFGNDAENHLLEMYLARSRQAPLTMTLLGEHAHRLHTLRTTDAPCCVGIEHVKGKLQLLEVLALGKMWGIGLPCHQIRSMHIESGLPRDDVAERFPNLTSLMLASPLPVPALTPDIITFRRLRHLTFASARTHKIPMDALARYSASALRRLDLSLFQSHTFSAPKLCAFLLRSQCALTQLVIKECALRPSGGKVQGSASA
ncbi:hypothetical protein C8R43DRAFT_1133775 [Mycena crocata]|nr:hypothetical protein C8R43DRAFT_1133775 [Mycena crocata]